MLMPSLLRHRHTHAHPREESLGAHQPKPPRLSPVLSASDRLLAPEEEPLVGSHLITPRRGYSHHGIYVGHGNVVHYKSAICKLRRGPVEEVPLASFALQRDVWVRTHAAPRFDLSEVARRARSRLGEDHYRLLSNNCEHLCEWCLHDQSRSHQVDRLLALPRSFPHIVVEVIVSLLAQRPACPPSTAHSG